jgi:hypothetical protein
VLWLTLAVEAIGALVIGIGMSLAAWRFVVGFPSAVIIFADVRLTLAGFLAIALEFTPHRHDVRLHHINWRTTKRIHKAFARTKPFGTDP